MKKNFYILRNGKIIRKQNTVYFISRKESGDEPGFMEEIDGEEFESGIPDVTENPEYEKRVLPVEQIGAIFAYGRVSITSGAISFLSKHGIPLHFFGYYGEYESTLFPKESLLSGEMHLLQARFHSDPERRMEIAGLFVSGAAQNMLKNLQYHQNQGKDLNGAIAEIGSTLENLQGCRTIPELMASEGSIRNCYYSAFDTILGQDFSFGSRSRRPPRNPVNAMISFGNSLVYAATINAIYHTQLDQTISFLHEPSERRFSLALDISEIFKPLFVDRTIFKLVNKKMISEKDFDLNLGACLLNDSGRRLFIEEFNRRMETTIRHRTLKRKVSYGRLPYLECLKLCKHLMGIRKYEPFVIWW